MLGSAGPGGAGNTTFWRSLCPELSRGHVADYRRTVSWATGKVLCAGENALGQLGDGSKNNARTAVEVIGISGVQAITAGHWHTCAVVADGIRCWGRNAEGQLGDGTTNDSSLPVAVVNLP